MFIVVQMLLKLLKSLGSESVGSQRDRLPKRLPEDLRIHGAAQFIYHIKHKVEDEMDGSTTKWINRADSLHFRL